MFDKAQGKQNTGDFHGLCPVGLLKALEWQKHRALPCFSVHSQNTRNIGAAWEEKGILKAKDSPSKVQFGGHTKRRMVLKADSPALFVFLLRKGIYAKRINGYIGDSFKFLL